MSEGNADPVDDEAEVIRPNHPCGFCIFTLEATGDITVSPNCSGTCVCPATPDPSEFGSSGAIALSCVEP